MAVSNDSSKLDDLRRHAGPNALIDLTVAGKRATLPVLVHDVQVHPVTRRPIHVDLFAVRMTEFVGVRARKGGMLRTEVELGVRVERGQVLARIVDLYGDEVETIAAPRDGLFVRSTTFSTVGAGERVITLGV